MPDLNSPIFPRIEELDLLALDLDGTVLCSRGERPLSVRFERALRAVQRVELPVTFVTGRTEEYALELAHRLGIEAPMVTYNGGRVYCPRELRILHSESISRGDSQALIEWASRQDEVVAVYLQTDEGLAILQNRCSGSPAEDDFLFGTPRVLTPDLQRAWGESSGTISKLIVRTFDPIEQEIMTLAPGLLRAERTHQLLIETVPTGVDKGAGLAWLCRRSGWDLERVLAVGDQVNDLPTFARVGVSVAMGDAPEEVRAAADFVAPIFAEDGCAQVLERLLERSGFDHGTEAG